VDILAVIKCNGPLISSKEASEYYSLLNPFNKLLRGIHFVIIVIGESKKEFLSLLYGEEGIKMSKTCDHIFS